MDWQWSLEDSVSPACELFPNLIVEAAHQQCSRSDFTGLSGGGATRHACKRWPQFDVLPPCAV